MVSEALEIAVIRGSAIRVSNSIKDFDDTAVDPDSHVIKLFKPDGSQQGSNMTGPTKDATGEFHQDIAIPSDGATGEWMVEWTITLASLDSIERIVFKVTE